MEKNREKNLLMGRAIPFLQMIQQLLGYPEVFTDMKFVQIHTLPLEERIGIERPPNNIDPSFQAEFNSHFNDNQDGIDLSIPSEFLRRQVLKLDSWRNHTPNELLIIDSCFKTNISLDSITKFSIRPPELRCIIREVGQYFRWFNILSVDLSYKFCKELLSENLQASSWIDGTHHQIKVRRKAFSEIQHYLSFSHNTDRYNMNDPKYIMIIFFKNLIQVYNNFENGRQLSDSDLAFYEFSKKNLVFFDNDAHLPIPVYSYIKPHMNTRFILHILLSMGQFDTEYDLNLQQSLRESLRYAGLIGQSNNSDDLKTYSNKLLYRYITEQLVYFPNGSSITDKWIVNAKHIFDDIIIFDQISHTELPPLLQTEVLRQKNELIEKLYSDFHLGIVNAAFQEMKNVIDLYEIPPKEYFLQPSISNEYWDAFSSFKKSINQSDASFQEQRKTLKHAIDTINHYMSNSNYFTKSFVIVGAPGSGKSFLNLYILLYIISKGL